MPARGGVRGPVLGCDRSEGSRMSTVGSRNPVAAISPAEAILNALPLAVIVIAADGKIKDANVAGGGVFRQLGAVVPPHRVREPVPLPGPLLARGEQWPQNRRAPHQEKK